MMCHHYEESLQCLEKKAIQGDVIEISPSRLAATLNGFKREPNKLMEEDRSISGNKL